MNYSLFNDFKPQTNDMPDWIPFLPIPGQFSHSEYGDLSFSPERNAQFVTNFKAGVYQQMLPVDAEHETKLSGALGWINDMRLNEDGSVDARVDWTDRGKSLIGSGRFRYVSPELYEEWKDPATGTIYQDVATGAAVTTRPFFKEGSLRPLLARDGKLDTPETVLGRMIHESRRTARFSAARLAKEIGVSENQVVEAEDGLLVFTDDQLRQAAKVLKINEGDLIGLSTGETMSEQTYKEQLGEAQTKLLKMAEDLTKKEADVVKLTETVAERDGQIKGLTEAMTEKDKAVATMTAEIEKVREAETTRRYTEMVKGDKSWIGDETIHLTVLRTLAKTFGEDSTEFKTYVQQQNSVAAISADSDLFKEFGHDKDVSRPGDVWQEIDKRARQMIEKDSNLSFAEAVNRTVSTDPELYSRYRSGR